MAQIFAKSLKLLMTMMRTATSAGPHRYGNLIRVIIDHVDARSTRAASITSFGTLARAAVKIKKKNGICVQMFAAMTDGNAQVDDVSQCTFVWMRPRWRSTAFTTPESWSNM